MRLSGLAVVIGCLFVVCLPLVAQTDYEIQVYGSDTVEPGITMVELHSNFTIEGSKTDIDGVLPTEHQLHETVEITHGFTDWFELGFYIFTSTAPNEGYKWVGDHIRPRVRAPEEWKWPVGVSISFEFGYQRPIFSGDTWTLEIRPIIDKQMGRWYTAFNPVFDRSFHGPGVRDGMVFSPNVKVGYDFNFIHEVLVNLFEGGGVYSYTSFNNWVEDVFGVNVGDGHTGQHYSSFAQVTDPITHVGKDDFYDNDYAGFFEDSWKARSNLTLNLGVRYEIQHIPQPPIPNTATPLLSAYTSKINTDSNNFGPRIGIAWEPVKGTVVRGGYGVFFASPFDAGVPTTPGRLKDANVFVAQGDDDTVIPRELLDRTWEYITGESGAHTMTVRHSGGHGIGQDALVQLVRWLEDLATSRDEMP